MTKTFRAVATQLGLVAGILTSMSGGAFAQSHSNQPAPDKDYQAIYNNTGPRPSETPDFDMSGTRGRLGLGANAAHPEGPGNVSN